VGRHLLPERDHLLRVESTRRVVENLFDSLNPGGYLFIGHSETLTGITDRFETIEVGGVFLHRKPLRAVQVSFSEMVEGQLRLGRATSPAEPQPAARAETRSPGPGRPPIDAAGETEVGEPESAAAHLIAAREYADDGDFTEALASAEEALRLDPLLAAARYILGLIHLRAGRTEEAIADFRRTVYADDTFVLAHLNLGNLHRGRREYAEACRQYEAALRALERAPEGPWSEFLGGFEPDVLAMTCKRSLDECHRMRGPS
jgi:chemotaxis protein methyltransferase CheR